ncbi:hypothetical protein RQP46_006754 [Phenoliferia psychrophenolica]
MKALGAPALVIYLAIGVVDLTLSFLLVSAVGADRVREAEDWVLDKLEWRRKDGEPGKIKKAVTDWKDNHGGGGHKEVKEVVHREEKGPRPEPTGYSAIATTAVLAYAIHKTVLLPMRLGLTVAVTPKVVRVLQSWGWKVGLGAGGTAAAATASKAS